MSLDIEEELIFSASQPDEGVDFSQFEDRIGVGFNQYGIRENYDDDGNLESVDAIFAAMKPGPPERRNGVRITNSFLDNVASKDYKPNPPHLKDHDRENTFARIGEVKDVWFVDQEETLFLMTRTPNVEGSQNHQEAIARYTHDPPEIRDGSLSFGKNYEAARNDDGEPEMIDGMMQEFSTTNFPGGYDDGGINAAFSEALEEAVTQFDDSESGSEDPEENSVTDFAVETNTIQF